MVGVFAKFAAKQDAARCNSFGLVCFGKVKITAWLSALSRSCKTSV